MSNGWNFADLFEALAERQPDALAQRHAGRSTTWAEFDRRADGIAAALLDAGVAEQDKVAQYLYNAPEYLESAFGAFKAGLATVNTNYRYTADELVYLWDNADVVAVVFHGTFSERIDELRHRLPRIHTWLWVDDGHGPCPDWATPYEDAATVGAATVRPSPRGVAPATTSCCSTPAARPGMPKGVMWRQDDLFGALDAANRKRLPPEPDLDAARERVTKPGPRNLPAAPLMHGTGFFNALSNLMIGGSVITMEGRRFDPVELLDTVEHERINSMSIVGDAFAKPILRALDAEPDRWDISSLRVIVSSGVIWSAQTKAGLLRHNERLIMVDSLGSSEAIGMASSTVTSDDAAQTATFQIGPEHPRRHRRRPRRRVGLGRAGPGGDARPHADRLLQGPREVGGHVPGHRRRPLLDPRRLRHASTPTAPCACSAGAASASTPAARRSTPRRSRRCSSCTRRSPTRPSSACPTSASARRSRRSSSRTPATSSTRPSLIAHVKERLAGYKAPKRVLTGRRRSAGPPTASSTTAPSRRRRRSRSA